MINLFRSVLFEAFSLPVALPLDDDQVSIVRQAIEERVGEKGVVEQAHSFIHMSTARHDSGGPPVPLSIITS